MLLFFVNASILIVSATVFFKNGEVVTEMQKAHDLLEGLIDSKAAPAIFGLGLFCAGQSSTLTGTMAGQIVMEGFIQLKIRPWIRRLLTRSLAIVPSVIVIAIFGDSGTYSMLIFSQVILSLQLPFAIIPLIKFTSTSSLMGPFVNRPIVHIAAWMFSVIIISMNIWLVGAFFFFPSS